MFEKVSVLELLMYGASKELIRDVSDKKIAYYKTDSIEQLKENPPSIYTSLNGESKLIITLFGKKLRFFPNPYFLQIPSNFSVFKIDEKKVHFIHDKIKPTYLYDPWDNFLKVNIEKEFSNELLYAMYIASIKGGEKILVKNLTFVFNMDENKKSSYKIIGTGPINIANRGFLPSYYFSPRTKYSIEKYF